MDRLFDSFLGGFGLPRLAFPELPRLPMPASDVTETDTAWRVTAELPGMTEKDVELALSGDTLTITGEKRQESTRKEASTTLCERSYGAFARSFLLPEGIDREKIDARFDKGVLTVTLPKTPAAQQQTRKIEVKPAAG
jgi:HSP20 family protein